MGCIAMFCTKTFLFLINGIFAILGLGMIGASAYAYSSYAGFTQAIDISSLLALAGLGAMVMFVSCCGICGIVGPKPKRKCFLVCYLIFMVISILAELAVGAAIYAYSNKMGGMNKDGNSTTVADKTIGKGLDKAEEKVQAFVDCSYNFCCGEAKNATLSDKLPCDTSTDTYKVLTEASVKGTTICDTMEKIKFRGVELTDCSSAVKYQDAFYGFFTGNLAMIGGLSIAFAVIQLLALIGACCIVKTKREELDFDNDASA